jgi:hypothetical protein
MTPADLIRRYIEIRDFIERKTKEFEESIAGHQAALKTLEGAVQQHLIDTGADNIKTEFGTAYRTTVMSVKLADRGAFIHDVSARGEDPTAYFTSAINKEKIKELIDVHGGPPAGVDITYIHKTNFRRS